MKERKCTSLVLLVLFTAYLLSVAGSLTLSSNNKNENANLDSTLNKLQQSSSLLNRAIELEVKSDEAFGKKVNTLLFPKPNDDLEDFSFATMHEHSLDRNDVKESLSTDKHINNKDSIQDLDDAEDVKEFNTKKSLDNLPAKAKRHNPIHKNSINKSKAGGIAAVASRKNKNFTFKKLETRIKALSSKLDSNAPIKLVEVVKNEHIKDESIKEYIELAKKKQKTNETEFESNCEAQEGVILKLIDNSKQMTQADSSSGKESKAPVRTFTPYYITINSHNIIIRNHKQLDKADDITTIPLNLVDRIKPYQKNNMSKESMAKRHKSSTKDSIPKCFTIVHSTLGQEKSKQSTTLCDAEEYYFLNKEKNNKEPSIPGGTLSYWVKNIIDLKNCKYRGEVIFLNQDTPDIKDLKSKILLEFKNSQHAKDAKNAKSNDNSLDESNYLYSMNKEFDKLNTKRKIQEKYLKEISDLFEESEAEQISIQRQFIQKLTDIRKHEEEMKRMQIDLAKENNSFVPANLNSQSNAYSSNAIEELLKEDNLKAIENQTQAQFTEIVSRIKKDIIQAKIKQIELMKRKFDSIVEHSEYLAKKNAQILVNTIESDKRLQTNNSCADIKVSKDSMCVELFGLAGKEECLLDNVFFCDKCCGYYIGSKFEKEITKCLVDCREARKTKSKPRLNKLI